MGQLHRDRLALLDLAVPAYGDIRRHLHGAPVVVEEPETVATARGLKLVRLGDQPDTRRSEPQRECSNVLAILRTERDQVEPLLLSTPQPYGVLLGRTLGRQEREAVIGRLRLEPPHRGVELELLVIVRYGEVDVPKVSDQPIGHQKLLHAGMLSR